MIDTSANDWQKIWKCIKPFLIAPWKCYWYILIEWLCSSQRTPSMLIGLFMFFDAFRIMYMWGSVQILLSMICSSTNPLFSRSHSQPEVDLSRPPELQPHSQVNMSVPTGATVRLHCSVTNVENQAVSWIRLSDYQILTNGLKTRWA